MIKVGTFRELEVINFTDFGLYLGEDKENKVLLPKKDIPEGTKEGDKVEAFIYKDSSDRLIATTKMPKITLEEPALLEVKEVTKIGAFLDWGLDKDLLLPYREQTNKVKKGDKYVVALYVDKSERLCATMKVYKYLKNDSPYVKDDMVTGTVIEINPDMGVFVAVDNKYYGMIPNKELHQKVKEGESLTMRVVSVREDGKLNLSLRQKAYMQIEEDSELILKVIEEYAGVLPYDDKATPEVIKRDFKMSKNAFKRGVGHLLKEDKILLHNGTIKIK